MKHRITLAVALALVAAAGTAAADSGDSSMNPFTGDSYAALQGGGHNLGERGTAHVTIVAKSPERPAAGSDGKVVAKARRPIDFGHNPPAVSNAS